ncbi:HD domain-containing protein [Heliobacillus mobilis]|uniref:HD domain-containing protein n=1 Tax=Heliobacterium mobile TaxID=28064 RepID=A0A6I3SI42_HELMO|nr:HD domain-containing protein [Heliobacterium mobile]
MGIGYNEGNHIPWRWLPVPVPADKYPLLLEETERLLKKLEEHDLPSLIHTQDVAKVTKEFIRFLRLPRETSMPIILAALLHDIGKLRVASGILQKPHGIDAIEQILIQVHSNHGASIIQEGGLFPPEVAEMVEQHHEHYDGSGYPGQLTGSSITRGAQIIGICDVFAMLREDRVTQKARTLAEAKEYLAKNKAWFAPDIYESFLQYVAENYG